MIRESLLVPAGPPASTPVTALAALTAETSVAAGGLGEECTLGRKLHFSFTQRQFLHRFQALANPIFDPNSVSC